MVRISLKEAYDDRSVIKKIADLEANKQNKLTAGQGVTIDGTTISVDTSDLATKAALNAETARLDAKIDDVDAKIPPLASKAELADEATRLDAKIDTGDRDLSSRIDASNVKIKTNADAILTIENELGSDALPGTIYYRISKVEGEVITLKPLVNDSIKKVDVEGDASTVYHKALHNSGIVENDAIPVASDTKAGVMSAGMYVGFNGSIQNLQARMAVLEGVGITYQLTGLPDNATSEQITAAFQAQYPNVPLMAGIRAADYDKAKIWQYSGTAWIQLTSLNINIATSSALGLVKGSETSTTNDGKIFVEVDGSMTVIGWDTLKALASAAKQSVDNLEPKVTQQSAKIVALEDDVTANAADITALQGTSANHESRISSLETTSAGLGTRMGAAETDIDTLQSSVDQQASKISALEADMNNVKPRVGQLESDVGTLETKVDQQTQSISGLSTEVNGLKTSKQDKLTAGENISIQDNVISAQSYVPTQRVIRGNDRIVAEFRSFLDKATIGDEFHILVESNDLGQSSNLQLVPYASYALRIGNDLLDRYFDFSPISPVRFLGEIEISPTQKIRVFEFLGNAYIKDSGGTDRERRVGTFTLSITSSSNIEASWSFIGGGYQQLAMEYYHNIPNEVLIGSGASTAEMYAIVNYAPKQ